MPRKVKGLLRRLRQHRQFLLGHRGDEGSRILLFEDGVKQLSLEPLHVPADKDGSSVDFSSCSLTASISEVFSDDSSYSSSEEEVVVVSSAKTTTTRQRQDVSLCGSCGRGVEAAAAASREVIVEYPVTTTTTYCGEKEIVHVLPEREENREEQNHIAVTDPHSDGRNQDGVNEEGSANDADPHSDSSMLTLFGTSMNFNAAASFCSQPKKEICNSSSNINSNEREQQTGRFPSFVERMAECYDGSVHIFHSHLSTLHEELSSASGDDCSVNSDDAVTSSHSTADDEFEEDVMADNQDIFRRNNTTSNDEEGAHDQDDRAPEDDDDEDDDDRVADFDGCVHIFHDNLPTLHEEAPEEFDGRLSEDGDDSSSSNDNLCESSEDEDNIRARWEHSVKMMNCDTGNYQSVVEAISSSGSVVGIGTVEIAEI